MAGRFKRIKPTSFMAMAAQMWPKPDQPIMYGSVEIEMTKALEYIKKYSEKHAVHVTVPHLVIATLARHLKGEAVDKRIDTGVTLVTPDNMNEPDIKSLLMPDLSKWLD